ncbi:hypothetical protein Pyn_33562 [Prunus yedoensis var. nudiflora]|uniref:Uncharacterized protein n=1 Tax=Prunus yedoensis var. nudiflora TaxID=2094558 RepID=A0A314Z3B1_PRUYE|nr:hypothetical protein Pyn_33562 [Prunus yedoensis var. nudiflora]
MVGKWKSHLETGGSSDSRTTQIQFWTFWFVHFHDETQRAPLCWRNPSPYVLGIPADNSSGIVSYFFLRHQSLPSACTLYDKLSSWSCENSGQFKVGQR